MPTSFREHLRFAEPLAGLCVGRCAIVHRINTGDNSSLDRARAGWQTGKEVLPTRLIVEPGEGIDVERSEGLVGGDSALDLGRLL